MVSESRIQTNHCLMKAFNFEDFLDPTRLTHDELNYYNNLTRALDKTIDKYVEWLGTSEAKKAIYEHDENVHEYFEAIDGELDTIIQDTSLSADRIIEKIYRKGLNYGYKDINRLPVFNDACKYGLKATQEYNFELIRNVSDDLRDTIKHHIFRGVAEGQTLHEVARAITDSGLEPLKGKSMSAYQRASLIAHTEIARSMTTGRLQSYANYCVEKVEILTAGDDKVCPICREASQSSKGDIILYTLEQASNLIPFHPACRCTVIAHIEHENLPKKSFNSPNVVDCTINNNLNISGNPVTNCKFTNKKESYRIAEELGYTYISIENGNEVFKYAVKIGNKYKEIELHFSKEILTALDDGEYGEIFYSKEEILRIFKNSPDWLKLAPEVIKFTTKYPKDNYNATGYHKNGTCYITPLAFQTSQFSHANLPFTLYHEMAHAFDWRMSTQGKYGLSNEDDEYFRQIVEDNKNIKQTTNELFLFPSDHAFDTDGHHEDFAESLAMVALGQSCDKKYAIITMTNGETVHYHDWKNIFCNRDSYFKNILSDADKKIINNFKKKIKLLNFPKEVNNGIH